MDRLDAMAVFVAVAEQGSFAGAARRLGRSPAAVTRAVAALEDRLATRLFQRTTRAVALTDAGARTLERGRRLLAEAEALESDAASGRRELQGGLAVTAPVVFGRLHVLPVVAAFLRAHPGVDVRLLLVDRTVSLVDEGLDVAVRIGHLPDSSLRAVHAGSVRRIVVASPDYLAARGRPRSPAELARHACIDFGSAPGPCRWTFGGAAERRAVTLRPRLIVNTAEAAIDAAVAGLGVTRVLSYQAEAALAAGRLERLLRRCEPPPLPIQVLQPAGRHPAPKVRRFVDDAAASLRRTFGGAGAARRAPAR